MADDELDELYAARPEEFTALRTRLVADAKRRGDQDAAKVIGAARKPTTAAWVVNALVLHDREARTRLGELGEQLRRAQAELNGARIRELSTHQRVLVKHLTADALTAAGVSDPSAALRDDVAGTFQAAVADADVMSRLGRLAKAERWSGFGGDLPTEDAATESTAAPKVDEKASLRAALVAAQATEADAAQLLSDRTAELADAEAAHEQARRALAATERQLRAAQKAATKASDAHDAAERDVEDARARLDG